MRSFFFPLFFYSFIHSFIFFFPSYSSLVIDQHRYQAITSFCHVPLQFSTSIQVFPLCAYVTLIQIYSPPIAVLYQTGCSVMPWWCRGPDCIDGSFLSPFLPCFPSFNNQVLGLISSVSTKPRDNYPLYDQFRMDLNNWTLLMPDSQAVLGTALAFMGQNLVCLLWFFLFTSYSLKNHHGAC